MADSHGKAAPIAAVTGASGFVGRRLCRELAERGYRVRAVLRPDTLADLGDAEIRRAALDDAEALQTAFAGAAVVFHLAGIAHTRVHDQALLRRVNVDGTAAVAAACRAAGVPRLVYFSSVLAQRPSSPYGDSKKAAEERLLAGGGQAPEIVILRPANVYGPGMQGGLMSLIRGIDGGWLPPLPRLDKRRGLVSVDDLAAAGVAAAEAPAAAGGVYAVSDGQCYTPNDLEAAIYAALGRKKPAWRAPRMLFLAAAGLAETAARLGLYNGGLRFASYRALTSDNPVSCAELTAATGYRPELTLADRLPVIIQDLQQE